VPSDKRARKRSKQERQQAHQAALQHRRRRRSRLVSGVAILAALGIAFIGVFSYMSRANRSLTVRDKTGRRVAITTTTSPDAPCPNPDGSSARRSAFRRPPRFCIDSSKNYAARFQTDIGDFTVELLTKDAPETVNNFVFLSRYHFYDGIPFNRVKPGFVVQGGNPPAEAVTGPGYSFADENVPKPPDRYQIGQVLMARDKPNANGSQFIIIMGAEGENLPLVFPLFGKVTQGMDDVVRKIEADGSPDFTPKVIHTIRQITIIES
jgi:cyclophilin family peptidyl-prolyl cis-trans isomerase